MTLLSWPAQNPKAGNNLGPAKADGRQLGQQRPGLSRDRRVIAARHGKRGGASYPVIAPHALALNILRRTRASRGFPHTIFAAVVGTRETKSNRRRPRVSLNA